MNVTKQIKKIQDYDFYRKKCLNNQLDNLLNNKVGNKRLIEQQIDVLKEYYKFISIGTRIRSLNSVISTLRAVFWFGDFLK